MGTLTFALLTISDRYSPSKVFFICAIAGALINLTLIYSTGLISLIFIRFSTGFCLAGIYPVGMKIAADYFEKGLGKALGYLVGALALGTALPHLIKLFTGSLDWHIVIITTSSLALLGGCMIFLFVPDGPHRKASSKFDLRLCFKVFKVSRFRYAAFGYFGHMWELYTLWAFIPLILFHYNKIHQEADLNIALWSFLAIGLGGIACVAGGFVSPKIGSAKTAFSALLISCVCCLLSFYLLHSSLIIFLVFLIIWGMSVIADSPQFSTLVAQHAPAESRGTALTIVNSIGFAITIVSLQVMNILLIHFDFRIIFIPLAIGPAIGLFYTWKNFATR